MIRSTVTSPMDEQLQAVNRDLAALLRCEPMPLSLASQAALDDQLVLCGVLGGKEVGKSSLINALAQQTVSAGTAAVGEGTDHPIAFVHEGATADVTARLQDIHRLARLEIKTHDANALKNVVLVDLPDFDSEFPEHQQIVKSIAPLLDRVLWVLTPRKIGDRVWVEMLQDVIKDTQNIHFVLNKVDELLADIDPLGEDGRTASASNDAARFWQEQHEWVLSSLQAVGCEEHGGSRFLISAGFPQQHGFVERVSRLWDDPDWQEFAGERDTVGEIARLASEELTNLRNLVLAPLTPEQARAIKTANRQRLKRVVIGRMEEYFDLPRITQRLEEAASAEYHLQVLQESTGPDYYNAIARGLLADMSSDADLADQLLRERVEAYPLLGIVQWPFGWLTRVIGQRVSPPPRRSTHINHRDPFVVEGRDLQARVESMRSRILADHVLVAGKLGFDDELPSADALVRSTEQQLKIISVTLENRLLETIRAGDSPPPAWQRFAIWAVFLWFPFVQPVLEGLLQVAAGATGGAGKLGIVAGLYKIVAALSATKLLIGFAVVGLAFLITLAAMYASALRAIRQARQAQDSDSPWLDAIDEAITEGVVVPLATPFRERLAKLTALRDRLSRLSD